MFLQFLTLPYAQLFRDDISRELNLPLMGSFATGGFTVLLKLDFEAWIKMSAARPPLVPTTGTRARSELRIKSLHMLGQCGDLCGLRATGQPRGCERKKREADDAYNDGDGGGSAQDLLHQTISVVQGFHDLPLALGDLQEHKKRARKASC